MRPRRLDPGLVIGGILVNVLVVLSVQHFPYQDVTNHLTRYVLLERSWTGSTPSWLEVSLRPTSYIVGDLIGAGLVHLLGPSPTQRVMALVPVVLLPGSMYVLLRRTNPRQTGWALVGVLFTFSWYYLSGFIEFTVGLSLAFLVLAAWWPHRASPHWSPRLVLAAVCAMLFYVHLVVPLILLGVMGLDWMMDAVRGVRRTGSWQAGLGPRLLTLVVVAAVVGVTWATSALMNMSPGASIAPASDRPVFAKLLAVAAPFLALTRVQFGVMLGAYLVALIGLIRVNQGRLGNPFAVAGPAFLLLYFFTPRHVLGAGEADVRWLAPACLLPFCMPGTGSPLDARWLKGVFALCVLHAAVVGYYARAIDATLAAYDQVLDSIPAGARVLPVVAGGTRYPRLNPYAYYALWHTIRTGDQVPGLFSATGREGRPMPYYEHIRVRHQLYEPGEVWGSPARAPLDCAAIRADYAFIVQAGSDTASAALIRPCGAPVASEGEITLYRVRPPP